MFPPFFSSLIFDQIRDNCLPTLSILLKSSLSTRRKWQLSSLRTMDAARGESVTRANFPKSSPSWSVHTTPWHTQMNIQLAQTHVQFTSLRSEEKYQEGRVTFWIIFVFCTCVINPRAAYLPVHWLCGVWVQSPKPVNHSDESRWAMHSLPNSLLVFPQTYREHKTARLFADLMSYIFCSITFRLNIIKWSRKLEQR